MILVAGGMWYRWLPTVAPTTVGRICQRWRTAFLYSSDDEGTAPGSISGRPPFAPLLLPLPPQAVVVVVVVVVARRGRPPPPPTAKAGGGGGARSLRNVAQPYIMAEPLLEMFIKSVCALILSARQPL